VNLKKVIFKNAVLIVILLIASFLRLYKISSDPVSLFGDELDVGYHAYSILKTGKDYSGNFMPLHFQSLAEWRTPLYLYSAVPTVAIFGINALGVRLPAAIFGILGILGIYLLIKELTNNKNLGLISAAILTINPWHLQYSRAGFEVTMLLTFLFFGLYIFLKSLKNGKYLWLSAGILVLTPLIYSTAKLFTLLLLIFLIIFYRKEIFSLPKKYLINTLITLLVLGGITSYAVLFSGGEQRFNYISVFSDPIVEPEVGTLRLQDSKFRGETGTGLSPKLLDRVMHNKFVFWGNTISNNFLESLSAEFLFSKGDPNPRHSPNGVGEFYKIEFIALILGLVLFISDKNQNFKLKLFILFWIIAGIIPASITRDGGNHATRLILILPPLIFLISYGVKKLFEMKRIAIIIYLTILILEFGSYLHLYYIHYPWDSERWWHTGWKESIQTIRGIEKDYDRVIITMADEPAWIFFAGWYEYPPSLWQKEFPIGNDVEVVGFGKISHTGKFYFGSPNKDENGIYGLEKVITEKDLYLASAKEIPWNLIMDPTKTPNGLNLIKSIAFPSGEPAFYLFTKAK
jgi:hypothetical protein